MDTRQLRAWTTVLVLLLAYAVSFLDRQILSLLVGDLKSDLQISDTQIGLLQGPAFGIFYAVMGLPFGWLADRVHRVRLIAGGILLWSLMTVLGGFSHSFAMLFATRMGVGVGEAALVPAAVSLLAGSFPAERRALPMAVFTSGVSVGVALSLALGGALVDFAQSNPGGWLAGRAPWQIVLILAGLVGVPVALAVLLFLREAEMATAKTAPAGEKLLPYLRREPRLFALLLAGASVLYIPSYATSAWMPSQFVRSFGWTPTAVGVRMGTLILFGALIGNIASGVIATRLTKRGHPHGTALTMAVGAALLAPFAIMGPLAPSPMLAQIGFTGIYTGIALCFGVASASFVAVTPPALRGRMSALYLSAGNLAGFAVGPPLTGYILQRGLSDPRQVGAALAIVAAPTAIAGAWLLWLALPHHRRRAAELVGG